MPEGRQTGSSEVETMIRIFSAALAIGLALIGPASAAPPTHSSHRHSVVTQPGALYMYAPGVLNIGPAGPDMARDQAIHDCSTQASKWSFSAWQSTQLAVYGTCMSEHGQLP
jgi:hypothetical protein